MVEGVRAAGIGGASALARDGKTVTTGLFAVDDGAAPLAGNGRLSTMAAIGLDSMLALQAVDEAIERDRMARRRGAAMIAALTGLQRAMLVAEDPSAALRDLNELTADARFADDPGLSAILRAVVLRSRVEIARRDARKGLHVGV